MTAAEVIGAWWLYYKVYEEDMIRKTENKFEIYSRRSSSMGTKLHGVETFVNYYCYYILI